MLVQNVLASVLENAQLAALEITDSTDLASMAEILDGVRASVARAAEVFEHLVRHAKPDDRFGVAPSPSHRFAMGG